LNFDFKTPDYKAEFARRAKNLQQIHKNPKSIPELKAYYKNNIADFICDWGMTSDPRNAERGLPVVIPFILFKRQRQWVDWLITRWKGQQDGLVEKSRDMGLSWLSVAVAASICLLYKDVNIGFGSRKEEDVDKNGSPKSLFWKARQFINLLPPQFNGFWNEKNDSSHMLIKFPFTGSTMSGEAGDNIGRGDRAAIYFKDESAFYERPEKIEAALSQTSNCKIDISTVNGLGNPFHQKRFSGKIPVFIFDWRHDPRKDEAWYQKQEDTLDPIVLASEVNRNYGASVEGVCIPGKYVQAAVNLHQKLGLQPSGVVRCGLDVADEEGRDMNAIISALGSTVFDIDGWKGKDTRQTTMAAYELAKESRASHVIFDSIGVGAGVRGDSKLLSIPFYGVATSSKDLRGHIPGNSEVLRKNYYTNLRAQLWWEMRLRFQRTWQHVNGIKYWSLDDMISIPNHAALIAELSQPLYFRNENTGKIQIESKKDLRKRLGRSPDYADALMLIFAPIEKQRRKRQTQAANQSQARAAVYE